MIKQFAIEFKAQKFWRSFLKTRASDTRYRQDHMSRTLALTLGTVLLFFFCSPFCHLAPGVRVAAAQTAAPHRGQAAKSQISFSGGPGDTLETAVVISGALNSLDGINAETKYLEKKFGRENRDWQFVRKSTLQNGDEYFDKIEIELKDLRKKTIFFNITAFFGKL
jgi:hypothetical protein